MTNLLKDITRHQVKKGDLVYLTVVTATLVLIQVLLLLRLALVAEDGTLLYSFYSGNNGNPLKTIIDAVKDIYTQSFQKTHILYVHVLQDTVKPLSKTLLLLR